MWKPPPRHQGAGVIETKMIFTVEPTFSLIREMLLIKFAPEDAKQEKLQSLISIYGARIVDRTGGCLVCELTDTPQRIDSFIEDTACFKVVESCRSGAIAMERGEVTYDL